LILSSHGGITREYPANEQKRIDLMIDTETFTIGIEKKYTTGRLMTLRITPV
jgi:hypothetical protein